MELRFRKDDGTEYPKWKMIPLGDLCSMTNGISKGKEYFGKGNKFVNLQDLFGKDELREGDYELVEVTDKELSDKSLLKGDVLFVRSSVKPSGVGLPCVVMEDMNDTVFSGFIIRARFFSDLLNLTYKKYCFIENGFRNELLKRSSVSANTNISQPNLAILPVKVPCLEEQQKIAAFLSSVDEVIAASEEEVKNLEEQKKGVMQKIFSQEVRFKKDDGSAYPEWEEKRMDSTADLILGGGTPSTQNESYYKGSIPWISSSDLMEGSSKANKWRFITNDAINSSATKLIPKGSLLIVSRVGLGKVAIADEDLCTSQDFTNLVGIKENIHYLYYAVHNRMQKEAKKAQGTAIKGITSSDIKSFKMMFPCLEEQQKIASFLSSFDEAIDAAKKELECWKAIKKGLLQQMFE